MTAIPTNRSVKVDVSIDNSDPMPGQLTVEQPMQRIQSLGPRPDPAWEYVDNNGHFHAYTSEDSHHRYPTLSAREEHIGCDGTCGGVCEGEGYSVTRYACRICDEQIEPGLIHGPYTTGLPGLTDWRLTVRTTNPGIMNGYGKDVSVRITGSQGPSWFGIALVAGCTWHSYGEGELELAGNGQLGVAQPPIIARAN